MTEVDIYRINKVSYLVVTVVYKLCKVAFPMLRIILMTACFFEMLKQESLLHHMLTHTLKYSFVSGWLIMERKLYIDIMI